MNTIQIEDLPREEATKINVLDGEPAMSSLRISEVTGKRHPDVTRDIKSTIESIDGDVSRFAHIYLDTRGRRRTFYIVPEREFMIVVAGYSIKYRTELIDELLSHRKEKKALAAPGLPQNYLEALKALTTEVEEKEALALENKIVTEVNIEQAEYIKKSEGIVAAAGVTVGFIGNKTLCQYASELSNTNIYGEKILIMPNVMRDLFKESGYLCKEDGRPCSKESKKFFEWKEKSIKKGKKTSLVNVLYINSVGQKHFAARILSFFRSRALYLEQRSGTSQKCSIVEVTAWRKKVGLKTNGKMFLKNRYRREML